MEQIIEILQSYGLVGLFLGSFMAATVVPFSSEVILTGVLIAGVNPLHAFFSATAGNWLGGMTTYFAGYLGKWSLIERWFGVKQERLIRQRARIERYGSLIAFFTWMPLVGDVLAIALGFYRIDVLKCAVYMLLGRSIRFGVWIGLYMVLGSKILGL